jgi:hypothetical protein
MRDPCAAARAGNGPTDASSAAGRDFVRTGAASGPTSPSWPCGSRTASSPVGAGSTRSPGVRTSGVRPELARSVRSPARGRRPGQAQRRCSRTAGSSRGDSGAGRPDVRNSSVATSFAGGVHSIEDPATGVSAVVDGTASFLGQTAGRSRSLRTPADAASGDCTWLRPAMRAGTVVNSSDH